MVKSNHAVIYTRISRDAEGDGAGVERQENLCRELAQQLNLQIVNVYSDNDVGASERTAKDKVRTGYNQLLEDAKSKNFSYILAYSNSRLTRRMRELEDLIQLHEQTGVLIKTVVSGDDDLSKAEGRMVARIKASVDVAESDRISERQQATFLDNAMKGKPKLQRQRPFGWKADGVTVEPEEAQLIREAVERIKQGVSITMLCKEWMEKGVHTAAGNPKWEWRTLKNVLLGWRTAGVRTYRREPLRDTDGSFVKGQWEAIITLEDREQALAMLQKRGLQKIRQGKWLLSGIVICGECGGKMYGQLTNTKTYACKDGQGHVAITAHHLESHVQFKLAQKIFEGLKRGAAATEQTPEPSKSEWPDEKKLSDTDAQIAELMQAYKEGNLSGEIVFPQINELDQQRKTLRSEREAFYALQAEPDEQLALHNLDDWLLDNVLVLDETVNIQGEEVDLGLGPDEDYEKKKEFLHREVKAVIVKKGVKGQRTSRKVVRSRVDILWRDTATR